MATEKVREVLLRRSGVVTVEPGPGDVRESLLQAFDLELAELGCLPGARLRARLAQLDEAGLGRLKSWMVEALAARAGSNRKHEPLFRRFPDGVPADTFDLWVRKVLNHFLQAEDQCCLFCRRTGTTHVLNPCNHVVCDHCFDGSNYSACPVCEHHVDRASPFFRPVEGGMRSLPKERVRFRVLDLCDGVDQAAERLVRDFCARKQALSPGDKDDFEILIRAYGARICAWIPEEIPVKENVALVFGTLLQVLGQEAAFPKARPYLRTATDVLRLIAAYSGADPALQREAIYAKVRRLETPSRFWGKIAEWIGAQPRGPVERIIHVPIRVSRFKVAKMPRPLRRALLGALNEMDPDLLAEDMFRHRSYWVWVGQFLHPHEFNSRFPHAACAFRVVRKKGPGGEPAPEFQTYYARFEEAVAARDARAVARVLKERPGEFARRFDHALRLAGGDEAVLGDLLESFSGFVPRLSTPVLLALRNHLALRTARAPVRIFWPKGQIATGACGPDTRDVLRVESVRPAVAAAERELLQRFGRQPRVDDVLIDESLRAIVAPFNERTASRSAVDLPRGSVLPLPAGKKARLFLHWCQPAVDGMQTDLDLSVGFYGSEWEYAGVCSYYQLQCAVKNVAIAQSAGDLRDAPYPDGATEFVDVDLEKARAAGVRYAAMVVNAYSGMPFSLLERSFAGLMLRDDAGGLHFDPRTVELKFQLQGAHGVFLPLVVDLEQGRLHWLDTYSRGQFAFNNVHTSNADIQRICPALITYFRSGVRASMYELALLHAASRAKRVWIRGEGVRQFARRDGEDVVAFFKRMQGDACDQTDAGLPVGEHAPAFAFLLRGDLDLPESCRRYVLFPEKVHGNLSASDLIA